jgi:hypothetical protein
MHIVVALGDPHAADVVADENASAFVVNLSVAEPLPLAHGRNHGAAIALRESADLLIFLDVDCIPHPALIGRYHDTAEQPRYGDGLLCGPVTYLPPPGRHGYPLDQLPEQIDPHPARPSPPDDRVESTTDYGLFWSLSFAVTATIWTKIGGFCERYRGYGGEDTDYAQCAAAHGIPMRWVGGAHAFHQFHKVSEPPVEHVDDIVRNAGIFHHRWGWWPMQSWLAGLEHAGMVTRDASGRPRTATS